MKRGIVPLLMHPMGIHDDCQRSQNTMATFWEPFVVHPLIPNRHESFSPLFSFVKKKTIQLDYQRIDADTDGEYKRQTKKFTVPPFRG